MAVEVNEIGQISIVVDSLEREVGPKTWDGEYDSSIPLETITLPAGTQVRCVANYPENHLDLFEIAKDEKHPLLQRFYQKYDGLRFVMSHRTQKAKLIIPPPAP